MSASKLLAGLQADAVFGESIDLVGDDGGASGADGLEKIGIGNQTQALVPGLVARVEVFLDLVALRKILCRSPAKQTTGHAGRMPAELVDSQTHQDVLPAHNAMRGARGQQTVQQSGDCIVGGQAQEVRGRALQHGDVRRSASHGGNQRDRGGSAADDHNFLAGVVQIFRPMLRMNDLATETIGAGKAGLVPGIIAVVAGASIEEVAGALDGLAVGANLDL